MTISTIPEAEGGARVKVLRKKRIELMGAPCSFGCCSELGGFKSFETDHAEGLCGGARGVPKFQDVEGKKLISLGVHC